MLQNKFEMPLDLVVKPSKIFYIYLMVVFIFAIVSIFISTTLPLSLRFLLFILLLAITISALRKQKSERVTHLEINGAGNMSLTVNNKRFPEMELCGECIVTYFIIWLNFSTDESKSEKKIFHVLLLPDSADKDLLRQLRVRLRFLKESNADKAIEY